MPRRRVVIVGGDAAGATAAGRVRATEPDAEVIMLERGRFTSYSACGIPFLVSGRVRGGVERLVARTPEEHRRRAHVALEQEQRVTQQINALAAVARAEQDYTSEQFMQWFIKEQVEEVATMSDLLRVAQRSSDVQDIEDYIVREQTAAGADPTAPRAAGSGA